MDFLELMAECSVALGGFAAIHAALRGSQGPRGSFRAWGTVSWAFTALLMAIVPPLIATGGKLDAGAWRLAHAIGLVPPVASMATAMWIDLRLDAIGHVAQVAVFLRTAQFLGISACLLLLSALAGWPLQAGPTTYSIAVTALFVSGVVGIIASFWIAMRESMAGEGDAG